MTEPQKPRVFLSYARADRPRVAKIAEALSAAGLIVWWDTAIEGGSEFAKDIARELDAADVVVAVWSATSVESAWVLDEAGAGRDRHRLVPVQIDSTFPPLGFRQLQSIDLSAWKGRAGDAKFAALVSAIQKLAGVPVVAPVAKAAPAGSGPNRRVPIGGAARAALLSVVLAGAVGAGIFFWPQKTAAALTSVRLGEFKPIGGGLTADLPASIGSELQSAFGANSAVQVTTGKADYLLQGDVRRVGDKLRYTVHLDDIDNGAVLWTGSTDYPKDSQLAPRQFAIGASGVIRCALSNIATYPGRLPLAALSIYLQACWNGSSLTEGSPGRGLELARRLTVLAPKFSYGWSLLAGIGSGPPGADLGITGISRAEALAAISRALELDPKNAQAYAVQAQNLPISDLVRREIILKHALTLRPSDCGCEYQQYAGLLMSVGRFREGVENGKRALDQEPGSLGPLMSLAGVFYFAGDTAAGDQAMAKVDEIYADHPVLVPFRLTTAMVTHRWSEAERRLDAAVKDDRRRKIYALAFEALRTGDPASRSAAIASLKGAMFGERSLFFIMLLAQLGESDAALVGAAHLIEKGGQDQTILVDPMLASVRGLPGYVKLLDKYGMMTYWKTTRTRPDFCTEPGAPAFCRSLA